MSLARRFPPDRVIHLAALGLGLATVGLAAQPIYANDTWIHLALGEAFHLAGPWLESDPHLFAAPGPPPPSSWLGSAAIYAVYATAGFTGLRAAHALAVATILLLAWIAMRRAGVARAGASAGVVAFVVLSTYRLVQLRPDLFTIAATLALLPLLIACREGPGRWRCLAAALLGVVWANVHAAFLLGPLLVLGAAAGIALAACLLAATPTRDLEWRRALRLTVAGLALLVASGANPQGFTAHLAYFSAGTETLALESVIDEWAPTNLLAWPTSALPPSLAAWLTCWLCLLGTLAVAIVGVRERVSGRRAPPFRVDPALLALAVMGLLASLVASRFLWLDVFAVACIGSVTAREGEPAPARAPVRSWLATVLLACTVFAAIVLHVRWGDWRAASAAFRTGGSDYAAPYPPQRYNADAVWFLADAGLEGRIYNDYPVGGFMSFWLAPRIQMASSGTMNVERTAMQANLAIGARATLRDGEDYAALLDRMGFDLFLGAGLPVDPTPGRPIPCTVRHLEHERDWMLVFRNLRSAVYLRRSGRNQANLDRIVAYYAREGVDFDRDHGFDPESVVERSTDWAIAHGLVPRDFESLRGREREIGRTPPDDELQRLATIYAVLGLYPRVVALDRSIRRYAPGDATSAWRLAWSLAQMQRFDDAVAVIASFERRGGPRGAPPFAGPWSAPFRQIRDAAPGERATLVAHLPLLRRGQLRWVLRNIAIAPARRTRAKDRSPRENGLAEAGSPGAE